MKKIFYFVELILILLSTYFYVYVQGLKAGEINYKHSHRMYLALNSAYNFGYGDCKANRPCNWGGD